MLLEKHDGVAIPLLRAPDNVSTICAGYAVIRMIFKCLVGRAQQVSTRQPHQMMGQSSLQLNQMLQSKTSCICSWILLWKLHTERHGIPMRKHLKIIMFHSWAWLEQQVPFSMLYITFKVENCLLTLLHPVLLLTDATNTSITRYGYQSHF